MATGKPSHANRDAAVAEDLSVLELSVPEIAEKYGISRAVVYDIARTRETDMILRAYILRLRGKKKILDEMVSTTEKAWASR